MPLYQLPWPMAMGCLGSVQIETGYCSGLVPATWFHGCAKGRKLVGCGVFPTGDFKNVTSEGEMYKQ